ncbi:MAG: DUF2071 domain-containing protein [Planctomycetes bacterium]|nr:DUF2071 domain-containing protein [Planctomycetota bacterium]
MPHPTLRSLSHRPFPPPVTPWVMAMRWLDLALLHWPVPAAALQRLMPSGLEVEEHGGAAWLGIVPFRMTGVRVRCLPPLPGSGAFAELNVRTYVRHAGIPGVWFFSLDAASRTAVRAARWSFRLPYFDARMRCERHGDAVHYRSERVHRGALPARFAARWWPTAPHAQPHRDTLAHWLVERYALFAAASDGTLRVGHIHHEPWQLAPARVEIEECAMTRLLGLELAGPPPLAHDALPLQVVAWAPLRVAMQPPGRATESCSSSGAAP